MRSIILAFAIALVAIPLNVRADPGFYEETTLSWDSDETVIVSGAWFGVRLIYNRELILTPSTYPGGCSLRLTLAEAAYIGALYEWAASDESPQQIDIEIELTHGGPYGASLLIVRGAVEPLLTTDVDTGVSPSSGCGSVSMTDDEAALVGGWLIDAALP